MAAEGLLTLPIMLSLAAVPDMAQQIPPIHLQAVELHPSTEGRHIGLLARHECCLADIDGAILQGHSQQGCQHWVQQGTGSRAELTDKHSCMQQQI